MHTYIYKSIFRYDHTGKANAKKTNKTKTVQPLPDSTKKLSQYYIVLYRHIIHAYDRFEIKQKKLLDRNLSKTINKQRKQKKKYFLYLSSNVFSMRM